MTDLFLEFQYMLENLFSMDTFSFVFTDFFIQIVSLIVVAFMVAIPFLVLRFIIDLIIGG